MSEPLTISPESVQIVSTVSVILLAWYKTRRNNFEFDQKEKYTSYRETIRGLREELRLERETNQHLRSANQQLQSEMRDDNQARIQSLTEQLLLMEKALTEVAPRNQYGKIEPEYQSLIEDSSEILEEIKVPTVVREAWEESTTQPSLRSRIELWKSEQKRIGRWPPKKKKKDDDT